MEIVFLFFLCAAVCIFAIIWKKINMMKCTKEIKATYLGAPGYSGKVKSPIVTFGFMFRYTYDNQDFEMSQSINTKSTITFNREKYLEKFGYKREEEYIIYINPNNPKQFKTKDGDSNLVLWLGAALFAYLGVLGMKYM